MKKYLAIILFVFSASWSSPVFADNLDLQGEMLNNEAVMQLILGLQNDPEFQKILQNPAIMQAIKANDLAALTSNPDFMKLLNNPSVGKIKNELDK